MNDSKYGEDEICPLAEICPTCPVCTECGAEEGHVSEKCDVCLNCMTDHAWGRS